MSSSAALKAPHLQLVPVAISGDSAPSPGSVEWSADLRARVKLKAQEIETGYLELGELLSLAANTRAGNVDGADPVFKAHWGYDTYEKWVEIEVGIHERKARALRRIYERITDLHALDPVLRTRLLALGWTKVRELVRVLTLQNAAYWVDQGEKSNYPTFRAMISEYASDLQAEAIRQALAAKKNKTSHNAVHKPDDEEDELPKTEIVYTQGVDGASAEDQDAMPQSGFSEMLQYDAAAVEAAVPLPDPVVFIPFNFSLTPESAQTLREALDHASKRFPDKSRSACLDVLALEYLAGYYSSATPMERRVEFLAKVAANLGLDILARDPTSGEVVYGDPAAYYERLVGQD